GNTRAPDNEVQLWDVADPENAAASATVHAPDTASGAVAVTPDGRLLAVTGIVARSGSETLLWNIADIRHPVALPGLKGVGTTAALTRQGQHYLLATGGNGIVALWDITNPAHASSLGYVVVGRRGDTETTIKVAFSPDGEVL